MPKSLTKSKHGHKASVHSQSIPCQEECVPAQGVEGSHRSKTTGAHSSSKAAKPSSASAHVERCWDKVLKKLCAKASGHSSSSPAMTTVPSQGGPRPPPTLLLPQIKFLCKIAHWRSRLLICGDQSPQCQLLWLLTRWFLLPLLLRFDLLRKANRPGTYLRPPFGLRTYN